MALSDCEFLMYLKSATIIKVKMQDVPVSGNTIPAESRETGS